MRALDLFDAPALELTIGDVLKPDLVFWFGLRQVWGSGVSPGFGESEPVASNETAEGRAQKRRMDVVVLDEGGDGG